jgi:AcrR family transcriptional regulator
MQEKSAPRSNQERTDATKAALITAARALFVEKGYANTGTPEIVQAAQVTRGALYHHFADKADLFWAVVQECAYEIAEDVEKLSRPAKTPLEALLLGAEGYFSAMSDGGRARLILLEAPAVLTHEQRLQINALTGERELREGLAQAVPAMNQASAPLEELTALVSAAFDQAALAIANGANASKYKQAMRFLLSKLAESTGDSR